MATTTTLITLMIGYAVKRHEMRYCSKCYFNNTLILQVTRQILHKVGQKFTQYGFLGHS